jgi:glycosyltransferase involved in cell wall biosynthesis
LPSTRRLDKTAAVPVSEQPPYKLAFLGRWHRNKGIDLLLASLKRLSSEDWKNIAEVRIFGGGPMESEIRKVAQHLLDDGRPVFTGGFLDKRDAATLIGWADYLMLPSRIESIPVIFSDAAQLGTPLIATPVGDLPRLQERYDFGILAESADPDAFCTAIQLAIRTEPSRFSAGLQEAAGEFSLKATVKQLLQDLDLA